MQEAHPLLSTQPQWRDLAAFKQQNCRMPAAVFPLLVQTARLLHALGTGLLSKPLELAARCELIPLDASGEGMCHERLLNASKPAQQ